MSELDETRSPQDLRTNLQLFYFAFLIVLELGHILLELDNFDFSHLLLINGRLNSCL